jgi:hypothetical protein
MVGCVFDYWEHIKNRQKYAAEEIHDMLYDRDCLLFGSGE